LHREESKMPFKSKAQEGWMFANHPEMARHWAHETPDIKSLPERVKHPREKAKANVANVARARRDRSSSVATGRRRHASR